MPEITNFYSGTSGLVLPITKWNFPEDFQDKSRLHYYGTLFNSIEINSTFYKLPKPATVRNWAEDVPDHFRFTFKIPKSISHASGLNFSLRDVADFMQVVEPVGSKKGCLLAQFPPSLTVDKMDQLQNLLIAFKEESHPFTWKLALEFRNLTWHNPEVYQLLDRFNAIFVTHDMNAVKSLDLNFDSHVIYLRLHGPETRYRGSYSDEFLREIALHLQKCQLDKKVVYVYFNNTMGGAFVNLTTLNGYVLRH